MPNVKKPIVPPGGFAGVGAQTQATQALFANAIKPARRKKRATRKKVAKRRPKKRAPARRKKRATRKRSGKPAHMVKGSLAAKRHMAKLRRMRKK